MSTLNDLHGKVPPPPVHVAALGFNGPWEVMTMKVRLATCRDRNVADYIAALWNLMPAVEERPAPRLVADTTGLPVSYLSPDGPTLAGMPLRKAGPAKRRRKAGKSVQVMP